MKRVTAAVAVILAGALWLVASSQGGSDHERLPLKSPVQKASPKELRLGFGGTRLFQWSMWAADRSGPYSGIPVCFSVGLVGPLAQLVNGKSGGPETGDHKCGPIKAKRGAIVTVPVGAGSITPPHGKTESWQSFDVGMAAYRPSVDQVRLVFSDGESEVLKARAVPSRAAFKGAEPFHYAVFAVHGCVSEVQGLVRGKVVARVGDPECDVSSE